MYHEIRNNLIINGVNLKNPPLLEPPHRVTIGSPPEKLNIICVWWGTLYPIKYVEILRNSINRNLTIPYEIFCLTDRKEKIDGITMIPTLNNNQTWWQKVNIFKTDLVDPGRRMYLDLDVIIVGSLDKIGSVKEPFCMIQNYGPNRRYAAYNSSVMVWTPDDRNEQIYTKFKPEVTKYLHGDQDWCLRIMEHDNIWCFPKSWVVSYKYSKLPQWNHINKDTSVYVFHGKPKPHEIRGQPREHWK